MSIDINNITSPKAHGAGDDKSLNRVNEQSPGSQDASKSTPATDTVSLSANAVKLGRLDSSVAASPVVDTQRVEQLRQAINDGSYVPDPTRIADKLMQFENLLKPAG